MCKFVNIVYIMCTEMAESAVTATGSTGGQNVKRSSFSSVSCVGGLKFLVWVESN